MRIAVPPKYPVSQMIDYIKCKRAIHRARGTAKQGAISSDGTLETKAYFVSTVVATKRCFGNTSADKRTKTNGRTSCSFDAELRAVPLN